MQAPPSTLKTLDRIRAAKLAGRLIGEIERVIPPDAALFHDAVMQAGPPAATQSLRYLPFNRQTHIEGGTTTRLSLVVLFNTTCMERFFLGGWRERFSRLVFRLSANEMDRFVRAVRLDRRLLRIMAGADDAFSILGIVRRDEIRKGRWIKRHHRSVYPLMLVPTSDAIGRTYIREFEARQTISATKIPLLPLYRKDRRPKQR